MIDEQSPASGHDYASNRWAIGAGPRPKEEVLFNVFEPKLVDSLLYAMIEFFNHGTQWGASCPLSPTLLLDLRLEAGYTFAPFGDYRHL